MSVTVIKGVTLFDGTSFHHDALVAFDSQSGNIIKVSKAQEKETIFDDHPTAVIVDGSGHTLLPGLIDGHIHCYEVHLPPGTDNWSLLKYPLRCGVTTVCDMHSDPAIVYEFRRRITQDLRQARAAGVNGRVTMADLKSSLLGATIESGHPKPFVLSHDPSEELRNRVSKWPNMTLDNVQDFIREHKEQGADYIKLMQEDCTSLALPTGCFPSATLELQTAIVDAAHSDGMIAVGHATSIVSTEIVLKSGCDGVTHTFVDQAPTEAIIELYKEKAAFVIPTLVTLSSLTNEEHELRDHFVTIASSFEGVTDDFARIAMAQTIAAGAPDAKIENAYESIRRLRQAGIDIVAGTDSIPGLKGTAVGPSMWQELFMLVERCGLTIEEALRSATSVSAARFKFGDRGVIEEGKRADLLLVKGSVHEDLSCLWTGITGVWKSGVLADGMSI